MPHRSRRQRLVADGGTVIIFVTGAAGLLGGALIAALIEAGHAVIGLVHRDTCIRGNDGQSLGAAAFDGSDPRPGTVMTVQGDVRRLGLGIDPATCAWLTRHVDSVIHCAALVRFDADAGELEAVNVDGTRHVAELFASARFIHVSTAYVCGMENGPIAETACKPGGAFGNGYEQSKAKAEAVVRAMRPAALIVRPSIIVGEAATGMIRSFDTIYRAFKFIAEGRIAAVPTTPLATLNFVPIDHVTSGIFDLVDNAAAAGRLVHLAARRSIPALRFLELIGDIPGLCRPAIVAPDDQAAPTQGLAERLTRPYWGYFERHPEFATDGLAELSGRQAPIMDDAALLRQIQYCVKAGFIRAQRDNRALESL